MRVLIVEDDIETAAYVRDGLSAAGCEVDLAGDGLTGLASARRGPFDVLVVDRMLASLDGLTLVSTLRREAVETPVLFLTAMGAIADRVEGLAAGGDDYLVKPFSMQELGARVSALARRPAMRVASDARLKCGDLTLDRLQRVAWRGARKVELLPLQFKLLEQLMLHAGDVVTRSMLLEAVWGLRFDPRTNIVETHVSHLRARIDNPGEPSLITTVRRAGYVIGAP